MMISFPKGAAKKKHPYFVAMMGGISGFYNHDKVCVDAPRRDVWRDSEGGRDVV
jgi:hypothetical protein